MAWPLAASLLSALLSLIALGAYGFSMFTIYLSALSAVASYMFWREFSSARGEDNREGSGE
jgi:hypothetical protein